MFQPILNVLRHEYVGAEVLLRWRHPKMGLVAPDVFIPLAEANGRTVGIGEFVLREACRCLAGWLAEGMEPGYLSVNVSRLQMSSALETSIDTALEENAIVPERLVLELTESVLMDRKPELEGLLARLDRAGVTLALDDFGTGYSSLNYLKHFPFSVLKVDRSFVAALPEDADNAALVRGIVAMAHSLGLRVIGEGVEDPRQDQFLASIGMDCVQGYLHGKPMTEEQFTLYLRELGADAQTAGARLGVDSRTG